MVFPLIFQAKLNSDSQEVIGTMFVQWIVFCFDVLMRILSLTSGWRVASESPAPGGATYSFCLCSRSPVFDVGQHLSAPPLNAPRFTHRAQQVVFLSRCRFIEVLKSGSQLRTSFWMWRVRHRLSLLCFQPNRTFPWPQPEIASATSVRHILGSHGGYRNHPPHVCIGSLFCINVAKR